MPFTDARALTALLAIYLIVLYLTVLVPGYGKLFALAGIVGVLVVIGMLRL